MSEKPSLIGPPPVPLGENRFQEMAFASWLAPLIAIGVGFFLIASQVGKAGTPNKVQMVFGPLFIVGGLLFGIIALFGIRKHGTNKILVPALIGIGLNLSLITIGLLPILRYQVNRARLQPAVHTPFAYLLRDDRMRFSKDTPEGFRDYPEGKQSPTIEHVYVKGILSGGEALTVINIERMGKLIPKNRRLKKEDMPPGFKGELTSRDWRGLKVDTFIAQVEMNEVKMVVYTMQLPLKPVAMQLNVGGPESKREELGKLADTLLSSLEGETNW